MIIVMKSFQFPTEVESESQLQFQLLRQTKTSGKDFYM